MYNVNLFFEKIIARVIYLNKIIVSRIYYLYPIDDNDMGN